MSMTLSSRKAKARQEKLSHSRAQLLDVLNSLSEEDWQRIAFSEGAKWTIAHIIGHLIESERGMSIQVHKIRKGEMTVPDNFDLERWNRGLKERIGTPSAAELLAALRDVRTQTLDYMAGLDDKDWQLTGRHPGRGIITIEQYYETIYHHELAHTQDIQRALAD